MIILPAIDIIGGTVVRLNQGKYDTVKKYSVLPLDAAMEFASCGATHLHVVDLDGAKSGKCDNAEIIEVIVKKCNMQVEVGGGIRTAEQIERYLNCGADKVILGTAAAKNIEFVEKAVLTYGKKIAVGVDSNGGKVSINGWIETTDIDSFDFCRQLKRAGVDNVIYTDISKDGKLSGTNLADYSVLCQAEYPKITASGGIKDIDEIIRLKKLGAYGAIIGKAIYERRLDLKSAILAAKD